MPRFRKRSLDRSTETVDDDNTVDGEDVEVKQPPKSTRANAKVTEDQEKKKKLSIADRFRANTTETDRNEIAVKVLNFELTRKVQKLRGRRSAKNSVWRKMSSTRLFGLPRDTATQLLIGLSPSNPLRADGNITANSRC